MYNDRKVIGLIIALGRTMASKINVTPPPPERCQVVRNTAALCNEI